MTTYDEAREIEDIMRSKFSALYDSAPVQRLDLGSRTLIHGVTTFQGEDGPYLLQYLIDVGNALADITLRIPNWPPARDRELTGAIGDIDACLDRVHTAALEAASAPVKQD